MRAFSACLAVVLGFSTCYMAACSSDSDAGGGAAGDAGDSSTAGSSGKGSSGAPGAAGATPGEAAGAAGAPAAECTFTSETCTTCLSDNCKDEELACQKDSACDGALSDLFVCACDPTMTTTACAGTFATAGGDPAAALVTCYSKNCAATCSGAK